MTLEARDNERLIDHFAVTFRHNVSDWPVFPVIGVALDGTDVIIGSRVPDKLLRAANLSPRDLERILRTLIVSVDAWVWERDAAMMQYVFHAIKFLVPRLKHQEYSEINIPLMPNLEAHHRLGEPDAFYDNMPVEES